MTLTKEQIEAIQARAEKASPGPWFANERTLGIETKDGYDIPDTDADNEFLAESRADIPALCQQALRAIELEAEVKEFQRDKRDLLKIVSVKNDKLAALQTELTATRNALEEERERCAKVCEAYIAFCDRDNDAARHKRGAAQAIASGIRALPSPQVKP